MCFVCMELFQGSWSNCKMPLEARWDCSMFSDDWGITGCNLDEFLPFSSSSEDEEEPYTPLDQSSGGGESVVERLGLESLLGGEGWFEPSELFYPFEEELRIGISEHRKNDRGKWKREKESENIEADHAYCTPQLASPQPGHARWTPPQSTQITPPQSTQLTSSQPTRSSSSHPARTSSSQPTRLTSSQPARLTSSQPTRLTSSQPARLTSSQPKHTRLAPPVSPVKLIKADDKSLKRQQKAAKERARRDYSKKILQKSERVLRMVNAPELQKKVTKKLIVQSAKRITDQGYCELRNYFLKTWKKLNESTDPSSQSHIEELKQILKDRAIVL